MTTIRLGLIGDEPGSSSFLGAYLNSPIGSGAEVAVAKSIDLNGERLVLEISSCQWQADSWLEIKNQTIKYSDGFMFICRPSGNAMKLRTIRKIIYSVMKVRGKLPMVVVSNELTSDASSSFDENLIHLQTLFSALRCPILRTTATKNDRMLAIMFNDIAKLIKKHDYSTDPKGTYMSDFESTLIRETDTSDDFFGSSPVPLVQEQIVPQWGADHQSARSVIFGSSSTPSPHGPPSRLSVSPSLPNILVHSSAPSSAASSPTASGLFRSPSFSQKSGAHLSPNLSVSPNLSTSPTNPSHFHTDSRGSEGPRRHADHHGVDSPRRTETNLRSPEVSARNSEVPIRNSEVPTRNSEAPARNLEVPNQQRRNSGVNAELRRTESPVRIDSSDPAKTTTLSKIPELQREASLDTFLDRKAPDTIAHLHEKMAATLSKAEKFSTEKDKGERLLNYSDIPSLPRSPESRNAEAAGLQFKHSEDPKAGEDGASPWDDSFNSSVRSSKTPRRDTDGKGTLRNPRPRKFPPVSPPHTPSPPTSSFIDQSSLNEDVFEDMVPQDVKIQRAHLQQQIIARKALLDKETELEEITCKIVVMGAPKSGKSGFIENIAQTGTSYSVYRDGLEEGVSVHFEKHLQKNWKCLMMEPARERKVAFQLSMTNADAYVVVYNICSRQSFESLPTFFQEIIEAKGDLKGPVMLIGTRLDDVHNREVAREEGQKAAQTQGSGTIFYEISSKTHQNVHTCFPSLLNSFLLRKFKPMSPKGALSPPMFVKTNSFDNRIKTPHGSAGPSTPTTAPSSPFSSSGLGDSSELKPPPDTPPSSRPTTGEGKSSGKMLSNLCQSMREPNSGLKRKKKQFFTGADAMEWLVQKTQASPQDAEVWCQKLMAGGYIRPIIMVDVSDVSISIDATRSKFLGGDELYLFDGDTSASNKVLNDRRTTFSGRPPNTVSELSLQVPFHSFHFFLRVKDSHYEVNFRDWEESAHFDKFSLMASELQRVDYSQLKTEKCRLAFWINVHNILAIHSCAIIGPPEKEKKRKNFFDALYQVGEAVVSIQDIVHGILRNNGKIPGMSKKQFPDDDPRIAHVLPMDPRIHFALWQGTKSSPFLGIYGEEDVHVLLQYATFKYLDREVEMSYHKNYIILPKIFMYFANDFGKDMNEVLLWIGSFFNTEKAKLLKCIMHQDPDIRYKEYDWTATPPELLFV